GARQSQYRAHVLVGAGKPGRILPFSGAALRGPAGYGVAVRDAADCPAEPAALRLPADQDRAAGAWVLRESQTGSAADARRQSVECAPAQVGGDHPVASLPAGLSELSPADEVDGPQSVMGGRYHLYPSAAGVRVSGGDLGCLLPQSHRLGLGSQHDHGPDSYGLAPSPGRTAATSRAGASFGSGSAVRQCRIRSGSTAT